MAEDELEKLLGGFAADTLTPEEKHRLYSAALQDQQLFDAMADEQALKELLADPDVRRRLLQALNKTSPSTAGSTASWLDWFRRPAGLAWAGGLAAAVFAVVLGMKVYQDSLKQAVHSVATEGATPPVPLQRGPAPSQPASPSLAVPPLQAKQDTAPAKHMGPKDSALDKMASQERPTPRVSQESNAQEVTRDKPMPEENKGRLQTSIQPAERGNASESIGRPADKNLAAGSAPPATAPMAAPLQAPAATVAPTVSARALFYDEGVRADAGKMTQGNERAMKPPVESEGESNSFKRKLEGPSQLSKAAGSATSATSLGLRYSFVIQNDAGQEQEIDTASASKSTTPVQLTIEINQEGYIQVWKNVGSANTLLLLPQKDSGHISLKIHARQRQRLPLPANSGTVIIRLSRVPFGPISRQEAALLNRRSPNLIQESVATPHPTGSQEQATYVVSQDPSPTAQIAVDILLAQQQ